MQKQTAGESRFPAGPVQFPTVNVLWVGEGAPQLPLETVADAAQALRFLERQRADVILARMRLPDMTGLELMRRCMELHPEARRILLAAYEDLPEIVRTRGLVQRVLPQTADAARIARAIELSLQAVDEPSVSANRPAPPRTDELLRWTAMRIARTKGAVVRPLPPDERAHQLQFVIPRGKRVESLREDVLREWLWPVKPLGAKPDRKHPVLQRLGGASRESEVYARDGGYLALLPWRREPKITAVLGVMEPASWPALRDAHALALEELAEFALPVPDEVTGAGHAVPEYDWIVTRDYAGPDRRRRPTSFLNRFIFFGRRRHVPSRIARVSDHFTDAPTPRVGAYAAAYLVLAGIDTWLTWRCVRDGVVREANPLLRPLVLHHPWWFLAVKNALAAAAFAAVTRFQLFRFGMWAVRAAVLMYLLVDLYWLALLR